MIALVSYMKRYPQTTFWFIAWATSFFGWYMSTVYPSDLWILSVFGSFFGGLLVSRIADGKEGLKTYLRRIIRWRIGWKWFAIALLLPLVLRFVALGLTVATGAAFPAVIPWPSFSELIVEFAIVFFIIALAEEPGFRGFALPKLLESHSALAASLILGALHAIWHAPLFILGQEPLVLVLIIISGAVLNTWLFNNTGGSVLIAMFLHASVNLWVGFFNPLFEGAELAMQTTWLAVVFVAMAALLVVCTGKDLGRKPGHILDKK
jgi:membrane protease YdiL (CAAX protease family)